METRQLIELRPHPINAEVYGDGSSKTLLDDMREHGFRTSKPIVITSAQSEIGGNVIISGHRRFNAAQMLQLDAVPVIVSPEMSRLDIEEEVIRANNDEDTQRERTTDRVCIGGEISPEFCAEIINRWENITGGTAHVNAI